MRLDSAKDGPWSCDAACYSRRVADRAPLWRDDTYLIVQQSEAAAVLITDGSGTWGYGYEASELTIAAIAERFRQGALLTSDELERALRWASDQAHHRWSADKVEDTSFAATAAVLGPRSTRLIWAGGGAAIVAGQSIRFRTRERPGPLPFGSSALGLPPDTYLPGTGSMAGYFQSADCPALEAHELLLLHSKQLVDAAPIEEVLPMLAAEPPGDAIRKWIDLAATRGAGGDITAAVVRRRPRA